MALPGYLLTIELTLGVLTAILAILASYYMFVTKKKFEEELAASFNFMTYGLLLLFGFSLSLWATALFSGQATEETMIIFALLGVILFISTLLLFIGTRKLVHVIDKVREL